MKWKLMSSNANWLCFVQKDVNEIYHVQTPRSPMALADWSQCVYINTRNSHVTALENWDLAT